MQIRIYYKHDTVLREFHIKSRFAQKNHEELGKKTHRGGLVFSRDSRNWIGATGTLVFSRDSRNW
jgi:hypothetical protein